MQERLTEIETLLHGRDFTGANLLCDQYLLENKHCIDGRLLQVRIKQMQGDFIGMFASAEKALVCKPGNMSAELAIINALINLGKFKNARTQLDILQVKAVHDANLLQEIAVLYSQIGCHEKAYSLYNRALVLEPHNVTLAYNTATAAIAVGRLLEAEKLLNTVIANKPEDYDAYYNRSTIKKQLESDNHIAEMEALLKAGIPDLKGAVQLFYALAKEYEDLGQYEPAFEHLTRGANLRASMLKYRVADDVTTMREIKKAFPASELSNVKMDIESTGPIFVLGLPRTGSTLVDRILSAHSDVASLGEINDLANDMMGLVGVSQNKADLINKSSLIDGAKLAEIYQTGTSERGQSEAYLLDKTPSNFLYVGLIARAMPNARIIHVNRHPMDSCFAIYKTLFRMGYPYSYRLEDLADYYKAYHDLMQHWSASMPGRIIEVSYEKLVSNFELEVQGLLDQCGLPFQEACLFFHQNKTPSATASAAQVRKPLYATSVGRWRSYSEQLKPLRVRLESLGIKIEDSIT